MEGNAIRDDAPLGDAPLGDAALGDAALGDAALRDTEMQTRDAPPAGPSPRQMARFLQGWIDGCLREYLEKPPGGTVRYEWRLEVRGVPASCSMAIFSTLLVDSVRRKLADRLGKVQAETHELGMTRSIRLSLGPDLAVTPQVLGSQAWEYQRGQAPE